MDVWWLEQTEADLPMEGHWLNPGDIARLSSLRFAKRRRDWRLGQWTAKRAVAVHPSLHGHAPALAEIEIRRDLFGAPAVFIDNRPAPISISISHRNGVAACALAPEGAALGCDLELIEPHSDAFAADYFTPEEQALVAQAGPDRHRLLTLLWSAKESALKALRTGLRLDTRSVVVRLRDPFARSPNEWRPLIVECRTGEVFHGWWQQSGNFIRTLVASPRVCAPLVLHPNSITASPLSGAP